MYYIVPLGNPGDEYANTRHNVGWTACDFARGKWQLPALSRTAAFSGEQTQGVYAGTEIILLYPHTYMNNSGSAVVKLVPKSAVSNLIVLHDDIDLPFGAVKIGKARGAGGNNGVQSIIDTLGTKDFIRIRIGIAQKSVWTGKIKRPTGGGPLERFVLKEFSSSEQKQLPSIYENITMILEIILKQGVEKAMNSYN